MLKDESIDDDQADDTDDEATDIASAESALWMAASNKLNRTGGSVAAEALTALEDHGPQGMADYLADALGVPVEVTTHSESGLPHLRFSDPADCQRWASPRNRRPVDTSDVDVDALGPVARAWFGLN